MQIGARRVPRLRHTMALPRDTFRGLRDDTLAARRGSVHDGTSSSGEAFADSPHTSAISR